MPSAHLPRAPARCFSRHSSRKSTFGFRAAQRRPSRFPLSPEDLCRVTRVRQSEPTALLRARSVPGKDVTDSGRDSTICRLSIRGHEVGPGGVLGIVLSTSPGHFHCPCSCLAFVSRMIVVDCVVAMCVVAVSMKQKGRMRCSAFCLSSTGPNFRGSHRGISGRICVSCVSLQLAWNQLWRLPSPLRRASVGAGIEPSSGAHSFGTDWGANPPRGSDVGGLARDVRHFAVRRRFGELDGKEKNGDGHRRRFGALR